MIKKVFNSAIEFSMDCRNGVIVSSFIIVQHAEQPIRQHNIDSSILSSSIGSSSISNSIHRTTISEPFFRTGWHSHSRGLEGIRE